MVWVTRFIAFIDCLSMYAAKLFVKVTIRQNCALVILLVLFDLQVWQTLEVYARKAEVVTSTKKMASVLPSQLHMRWDTSKFRQLTNNINYIICIFIIKTTFHLIMISIMGVDAMGVCIDSLQDGGGGGGGKERLKKA